MGAIKMLRRSISKFLQNYHYFTSIPVLCILPFSITFLLSQVHLLLFPSSHPLPLFRNRLLTLFMASGFPASSGLYSILALKISETVASYFYTLPYTFTFLLIGKSLTLGFLSQSKPSARSVTLIYVSLLKAYICGATVILSTNATAFFMLFLAFDSLEGLGLTSPRYSIWLSIGGVILYSMILGYVVVVCSLALTISGIQKRGGYTAILKACFLVRGRKLTALSLAIPVNLVLAATEALFQYRVATAYRQNGRFSLGMVSEGCFIAYWYSVFIVVDTIIGCMFLKSCQVDEDDEILLPH